MANWKFLYNVPGLGKAFSLQNKCWKLVKTGLILFFHQNGFQRFFSTIFLRHNLSSKNRLRGALSIFEKSKNHFSWSISSYPFCSKPKTHQRPNLIMLSGTFFRSFFSQLHRLSRCAMASHPIAQATRDWNAAHCYTCSIVRRVSIVRPRQLEHILAWSLGIKMAPPGLSSRLRGSLVWRGHRNTSMGFCAGMLVHLNPRLGMVRKYDEDPWRSKVTK